MLVYLLPMKVADVVLMKLQPIILPLNQSHRTLIRPSIDGRSVLGADIWECDRGGWLVRVQVHDSASTNLFDLLT